MCFVIFHHCQALARAWRQESINSERKRVCMCVRQRDRSEGGPASERRNEWEIEMREGERESCVFGSRTTHVTLPCPSLCFPHSLTWPELYPHHHIHKGLCLQTSPYLWFIAQWRARCLLMVLPAAHGITSTFFSTRSCSKYVGNPLLLLRLSVHWRSDRTWCL